MGRHISALAVRDANGNGDSFHGVSRLFGSHGEITISQPVDALFWVGHLLQYTHVKSWAHMVGCASLCSRLSLTSWILIV